MSQWVSLMNLPKVEYYQAAREAFIEVWSDVMPPHVFENYVHLYPEIGASVTFPGQVSCTNGLEKSWFWKKQWTEQFASLHKDYPRLHAIFKSEGKRCSRFIDSQFQTEPNHSASTWELLMTTSLSDAPPDDAIAAVFYSLVDGILLTHGEAVGRGLANGGYVMYRFSLIGHKVALSEARKAASVIGGGHSDLARIQREMAADGDGDLRQQPHEVRM